jgi:uncharacterized repeat protein (TIGR01451 family)
LLITGGNSTGGGVRDVTYFNKQRIGYDTLINVAGDATLRIGDYPGPSLAKVDGTVKQDGALEIDVYNPFVTYPLDASETAQYWGAGKFSDRIKIDSGIYTFGANPVINPAFDPAFAPYIEDSLDYWLPVIMFRNTSAANIRNAANVTVNQTLPGWALEFAVGNGTGSTVTGWGYLHFSKFIMHKTARLIFTDSGLQPELNGTYPNPIAVMGADTLLYTIEAINASQHAATMVVTDTLPAYLQYIAGTAAFLGGATGTITAGTTNALTPNRDTVQWTLTSVPAGDTVRVSLKAQTACGSTASQPLYVNTAWVREGNEIRRRTTGTYHQGAGTSVVTFSAAAGGIIFNAEPQAVEYGSAPRSDALLVLPDEGYRFAGWSHPAYISHRGVQIPAAKGIMDVETLPVKGNVELRAEFVAAEVVVPDEPFAKIPTAEGSDSIARSNTVASDVWSSGNTLYVKTVAKDEILRIYTPDGVLQRQYSISATGLTTYKLRKGVYIVALGKSSAKKILIE